MFHHEVVEHLNRLDVLESHVAVLDQPILGQEVQNLNYISQQTDINLAVILEELQHGRLVSLSAMLLIPVLGLFLSFQLAQKTR